MPNSGLITVTSPAISRCNRARSRPGRDRCTSLAKTSPSTNCQPRRIRRAARPACCSKVAISSVNICTMRCTSSGAAIGSTNWRRTYNGVGGLIGLKLSSQSPSAWSRRVRRSVPKRAANGARGKPTISPIARRPVSCILAATPGARRNAINGNGAKCWRKCARRTTQAHAESPDDFGAVIKRCDPVP